MIDPTRDLGHVDRDHRTEKKDRDTADVAADGGKGKAGKQDKGGEGDAGASGALRKSPGNDAARTTGLVAEGVLKDRPEMGEIQNEDCKDCA